MSARLTGRQITLGVTGSIAAYKAVLLARLLLKEGARVRVVMTASAGQFVGPSTFAGLTGEPVLTDMFDAASGGERHVALAAESDLVLIVPATADVLARLAAGRADDLLAATVLCSRCPVLAAPAMHPAMWANPSTKRNVADLTANGRVELLGPVDGEVASGETGLGRMVEPETVLAHVLARFAPHDLEGRKIVVTAGPTVEDLDPVRFLSNRSSGKMGFSLAEEAALRGGQVTLIAGPVTLPTPAFVRRIDVRTAIEMRTSLRETLGKDLKGADAILMCAAVGDFRAGEVSSSKLKRGKQTGLTLNLVQNPDILSEIGATRRGKRPILVGFAVETGTDEQIVQHARSKLRSKRVDVVVANHAAESMGRDDNRVILVDEHGEEALSAMPKRDVASRILDWIARHAGDPRTPRRTPAPRRRSAGPGVVRAKAKR